MKRFLQKQLLEMMKKKILGTSDAWSMSHSSQQPSKSAYCIEDWLISSPITMTFVRRHKTRTSSIRMIKTEARKLSLKICGKEKKIAKTDLCNKEQEEREGTLG